MKKGHVHPLLLHLFCFLMASSALAEEPRIQFTESVQLRIADVFMADAEYYRAITEYKKFIILFPVSDKLDYAHFSIAMAYYRGEEYENALPAFAEVRKRFPESPYASKALYMEGLCQLRLKDYESSRVTLQAVRYRDASSNEASLALLAKSLVAFDTGDTKESRRQLDLFLDTNPPHPDAGAAHRALALVSRYEELPMKSESLAGMLSAVVPGGGYAYAGRYGDGAMAFLVNALFMAGTIAAIDDENYAVAGIVGGVGLPFYIGNIYGSAAAARQWNVKIRSGVRDAFWVTLDFVFQ